MAPDGVRLDTREVRRFARIARRSHIDIKREMDKAGRDAAKIIRDAVRDEAPRGTSAGSSQLAKLIRTRGNAATQTLQIGAVGSRRPVNIAWLVIKGHRKRGGGSTRANDFVGRAISDHYKGYLDLYKTRISKAISKLQRRINSAL